MKKILVKGVILTVSGILVLGGCSADHDREATQESRIEQESAKPGASGQEASVLESVEPDSSERAAAEQASSEQMDSDTAENEAAGSVPTIKFTQDRKEWYTDDGEVLLLEVDAAKAEVVSEGFDALRNTLAAQWKGLGDYENKELEQSARDHYNATAEEYSYFPNYSVSETVEICRLDNRVLSLCENGYEYMGGAHGNYGKNGRTFDVVSGEELQIEDILSDPDGFYDKAIEYILDELNENYEGTGLFADYEETVRTDTFGETHASWYLDTAGIVIDYPLYLIAPYATGMPSVTLPYDVFSAYIKEDYQNPGNSLVAKVKVNEDFSGLIGESGEVMLTSVYPDEYSDAEVAVVSGDASEIVGRFGCVVEAYVIKREDGRSFLIFYCDEASDDYITYVYEVTGGTVRACDKLNGASWSGTCVGTDQIGFYMHLDVLGTYAGRMIYQLTDDGKLEQTEEIFTVNAYQSLKVIKDLPVTIDGAATTIPAGSRIWITGTDNAGKAYFRMDIDGEKTGMVEYVRDDEMWQILIDGVSENEYFEMVPYAG